MIKQVYVQFKKYYSASLQDKDHNEPLFLEDNPNTNKGLCYLKLLIHLESINNRDLHDIRFDYQDQNQDWPWVKQLPIPEGLNTWRFKQSRI